MEWMKRLSVFMCCGAMTVSSTVAFGATDKAKLAERLQDAQAVVTQIMSAPDKGIPSSILSERDLPGCDSELQEKAAMSDSAIWAGRCDLQNAAAAIRNFFFFFFFVVLRSVTCAGEPGGEQQRVAGDVEALLQGLLHAAPDHVLDFRRLERGVARRGSALISSADSSSARTLRKAPPLERPIGVRTASTMTTSVVISNSPNSLCARHYFGKYSEPSAAIFFIDSVGS